MHQRRPLALACGRDGTGPRQGWHWPAAGMALARSGDGTGPQRALRPQAIVGVLLGALLADQNKRVIRWLHALAALSFGGVAALLAVVKTHGSFGGAPVRAD
jgi:hypothetical protein